MSTRVLRPRYAVIWAAFFNFVAFLVFGLHVAGTVGSGIIDVATVGRPGSSSARSAARIAWNLLHRGAPASRPPARHALIGGLRRRRHRQGGRSA
ncbi:inorganic phosphate transporter [Caulobacter segnis]